MATKVRDAGGRAERYEESLALHGPEPVFNEDGVDLTQVRAALARTPLERLLHHEASSNSVRWMLAVAKRVRPPGVEAV